VITVYFVKVRLLLLWRALEDIRASNMAESARTVVSFPDPPTHTLPLPLNYGNVEVKNAREGSGK